jgi:hypothetical protein
MKNYNMIADNQWKKKRKEEGFVFSAVSIIIIIVVNGSYLCYALAAFEVS